jgi:hypothetical protein
LWPNSPKAMSVCCRMGYRVRSWLSSPTRALCCAPTLFPRAGGYPAAYLDTLPKTPAMQKCTQTKPGCFLYQKPFNYNLCMKWRKPFDFFKIPFSFLKF